MDVDREVERLHKRHDRAGVVAATLAVACILSDNAAEWLFVAGVATARYLFFAMRYWVALYKVRRFMRRAAR